MGGFSLIELVLTTIIVGLVAAMAVPRYADALSRYRADAAARRIVADIQRAQAHAKATSSNATVRLRVTTDRIEIQELTDLDRGATPYATRLDEDPYLCTLTSASFDGDETLVFDGYGQPDSGGTATLRCGATQRIITVHPQTGEATIQ